MRTGDLFPNIEGICTDGAGNPIDLSDAVGVRFHMGKRGSAPKIDADAQIVDAPAGKVSYSWQPGDTDEAGTFDADFEVRWPGSLNPTETFPSTRGLLQVRFTREIA